MEDSRNALHSDGGNSINMQDWEGPKIYVHVHVRISRGKGETLDNLARCRRVLLENGVILAHHYNVLTGWRVPTETYNVLEKNVNH